jgi:hypothetical protein
MLVHLDHVAGIDDGDARTRRRAERRAHDLVAADKDDVGEPALRPVQQRAPDDLIRGVVATHRVDRDAHQITCWWAGASWSGS